MIHSKTVVSLVLVAALLPVVDAAREAHAGPPSGLTGWRAPQGIFLSWSATGGDDRVGVWRGTGPGSLAMLAILPAGQAGFLDLGVTRTQEYAYALGDERRHGPPLVIPGSSGKTELIPSLVTTCSGLFKGKYPVDARNYFNLSKDGHVEFFGMYLVKPYDSNPRQVRIVWRDAEGEVFSELSQPIVPQKVDLQKRELVGRMVIAQAIGLKDALPQNGQKRTPTQAGLHSIEVFVDEAPVSRTVFFIMPEAAREGPAASEKTPPFKQTP